MYYTGDTTTWVLLYCILRLVVKYTQRYSAKQFIYGSYLTRPIAQISLGYSPVTGALPVPTFPVPNPRFLFSSEGRTSKCLPIHNLIIHRNPTRLLGRRSYSFTSDRRLIDNVTTPWRGQTRPCTPPPRKKNDTRKVEMFSDLQIDLFYCFDITNTRSF